jgi:hypothetical protein
MVAVVQGVNASAFSATLASTGSSNTLFVVLIANNGGATGSVTGVTIGGLASNFAQQLLANDAPNSQVTISVWMCPNAPSGKTALVVTPSANLNNPYLEVYEVSGMGSTPSLDVYNLGPTKAGTQTWTSGSSGTTSGTTDFVLGMCGSGPYSSGDALTGPGGSWVNASSVAWAGGASIVGYQIASAAGAFTYNGTSLDYDYYQCMVVAFQVGGGTTMSGSVAMQAPYVSGLSGVGNYGRVAMQAMSVSGIVQVTANTFPQQILGLKFEMLLNGTWTDVSTYVYQRDDITINRGETDETQQITPATITFTLNNQNGLFSPKNTSSPFYPYITRNVQFRISILAYSSALQYYQGYRFWGEVSEWPPQWDQSGTDVYVQIQAGGILRRYIQGKNLGSAIKRYYMLYVKNNSAYAPASYWPMEDGSGSTFFQNAIVPGETIAWGTTSPTIASDANCLGSDPLPLVNNSILTGTCVGYNNSGPAIFNSPGTFIWVCPGTITSLSSVETWGPAGGGSNGFSGNSGAGGEYAKDTSVGVTPGNQYIVVVGAGGAGGPLSQNLYEAGQPGSGVSSFQADSVLTQAGWGTGGLLYSAGFCQTESTSATHFPGGAGNFGDFAAGGGAGGGSSGGSGGAGNAGGASGGPTGGGGGHAVAGGAAGGHGGNSPNNAAAQPGANPGGGGGAGCYDTNTGAHHSGQNGGNGQVKLTYGSATTPNNVVLRFVIDVPTTTAAVNGTALVHLAFGSGGLTYILCYYGVGGQLGFRGVNGVTTEFDTGLQTFNVEGNGPMMISLELAKSGSGIAYTIANILQGATSITHTYGGTLASTAMGNPTTLTIDQGGNLNDWAMGHFVLQYAHEPLTNLGPVLNGHNGETAGARFTRICAEEGFTGTIIGSAGQTPQMGPQTDQTFTELLQEIQDVDQGLVFEPRGFFGLSYITREAMYNQSVALILNYTSAEFGYPLAPGYDDQLIRNDVTVSRVGGSTVQQVLTTGALSINTPPNGVGDYPYTLSANTYNDTQIQNLNLWILTKGTVDEYRYPVVIVDMTRQESAAIFTAAASLDIGQYFQGTNMPVFLPNYTINQLAWGFQEILNAYKWTIGINAVPESPYSGSGLPTW